MIQEFNAINQMPETDQTQITIEKSPAYFHSKNATERIKALNPNMKIIIVVRDPVTRAISGWGAIKIGVYHRHLKRWLDYFPMDQIHIVDGERLITHPALEVSRTEYFLGLQPGAKLFVEKTSDDRASRTFRWTWRVSVEDCEKRKFIVSLHFYFFRASLGRGIASLLSRAGALPQYSSPTSSLGDAIKHKKMTSEWTMELLLANLDDKL
uniref:Sulfotransfer_1 domain-containing protein n=1 Tax=Heterorhabditis bacteriophora TaxID=37862 RepID=A0A1I7X8Q3_HETBA